MNRLRSWGVPGFRRGTAWRSVVAVLGYAVLLFLFLFALFQPFAAVIYLAAALTFVILVTDSWGLRQRALGSRGSTVIVGILGAVLLLVGGGAWVVGVSAGAPRRATPIAVSDAGAAQPSVVAGAAPAQPAPTPRPPAAAQAAQTVSAQATAGAAPLIEAARAEAVDLLGQAVSRREAGDVGIALELGRQALGKWPGNPEAQSFLATVQPQATAQVREAATAQAQAAAQARQQATTQASAAGTAAAAANLQIVSISSPAARNSTATLAVRTVPGARCGITVQYRSGPGTAAGLEPKVADARGAVSWSWQVGGSTTLGQVPVGVSCSSGDQRWERTTSFVVS